MSLPLNDPQQKPWHEYSKVTKSITDIFAVDPTDLHDLTKTGTSSTKVPKRILIEGAPGIGKTVLAKEIAYQWATNEILTEIKIVFLLYLRDPKIQSVNKVGELVEYVSNECLTSEQIIALTIRLANTKGKDLCIVMDGFDEFPTLLQKNSFIVDIIKGVFLPEAVLVVTSRPTATVSLHDIIDRRIDILGLPKEEREKFISQVFSNLPENKDKLDTYLKQQPIINGLCFVPLHLAILLYLFQQGSLPETLTEMNESFILHTIYRHLEKHGLSPSGPVGKLVDVPKPVLDIVYNLSELAFNGLQENQLVFTFDEIKQTCPYIDETLGAINGFGLLQAVEHYPHKGAGTTKSFNFLHYTMQEFLAALHVSTLSSERQSSLMRHTFWDGEYNFMWMMYVGILGIRSDIFVNFISKRDVYTSKRGIKIAKYIRNDKRKLLHVFQCYLEAKENTEIPEVISSIFKDGKVIFSKVKLLPHNITSLMYFICTKPSIQWKSLELQECKIGDVGMSVLQQFISDSTSTLEYVDLSHNDSSPWGVYCAIIRHCSVNSLALCGNDGIEVYANEIKEALQANTTLISLSLCDINKNGAVTIAKVIQANKTLQNLTLCNMDDNIVVTIAKAIQANTTLRKLNLRNNKISSNAAATATNTSRKSKIPLHIRKHMSRNKFTGEEPKYTAAAEGIQVNTALEQYDLPYHLLYDDYDDDDDAIAVSKYLRRNSTLEKLDMSKTKISSEGAKYIAEAIQVNTTLEQLDVPYNLVVDGGAAAISDGLRGNTTLQELNISHNGITNTGIKKIAEAIQVNSTLQNIKVSRNHISIKGLQCFMEAVKNNCTLRVVNITHNNVTKSGFTSIEQCTESFKHPIQVYASWNEILSVNGELSVMSRLHTFQSSKDAENDLWSFEDYDHDHIVTCLTECLKEDDTLLELKMSKNKIFNGRESDIIEAIKVNTTLQKLDVSFMNTNENFVYECLKNSKSLKELNMSNNKMTIEGAKIVAQAIQVSTTLEKLDLSFEKLSIDGICIISDSLKSNNSLRELNISKNRITTEGAKLIAEVIETNTMLKQLDLSINKILDDGATLISNSLKSNITLQELNISHNNITNKGIKKITKVIQLNSTLRKINISKNCFSIEGLLYFMEAVKNNCTLSVVNVTHNNVTRSGFTSIKQCIDNLQHPIQIITSWNEINKNNQVVSRIFTSCAPDNIEEDIWLSEEYDSDYIVMCLSECLKEDDTLQALNLSRRKISSKEAKLIAEAIKMNKTLTFLDISENSISDEGAAAICDGLRSNNSLQKLDMSFNNITSKGAKWIAKAIKVNVTLHTLHLYQDFVDELSFNMTILTAVYHNDTLMKLSLPNAYNGEDKEVIEKINKQRTKRGISAISVDHIELLHVCGQFPYVSPKQLAYVVK